MCTLNTVKNVSLEEVINLVTDFVKRCESFPGRFELSTSEALDLYYIIQTHPQKENIPSDLFAFFKHRLDKSEDLMVKHGTELTQGNEYLIRRNLKLAEYYIAGKNSEIFWKAIESKYQRELQSLGGLH